MYKVEQKVLGLEDLLEKHGVPRNDREPLHKVIEWVRDTNIKYVSLDVNAEGPDYVLIVYFEQAFTITSDQYGDYLSKLGYSAVRTFLKTYERGASLVFHLARSRGYSKMDMFHVTYGTQESRWIEGGDERIIQLPHLYLSPVKNKSDLARMNILCDFINGLARGFEVIVSHNVDVSHEEMIVYKCTFESYTLLLDYWYAATSFFPLHLNRLSITTFPHEKRFVVECSVLRDTKVSEIVVPAAKAIFNASRISRFIVPSVGATRIEVKKRKTEELSNKNN